jgi:hypothetical protein
MDGTMWFEILKIIVDKLLLGGALVFFGYVIAKKVENYKSQIAYRLFVWQQQTQAFEKVVRLATAQRDQIGKLYRAIAHVPLEGRGAALRGLDSKEFATVYETFRTEMLTAGVLLTPRVVQGSEAFMSKNAEIVRALSGQLSPSGLPTMEDIDDGYVRLVHICHSEFIKAPSRAESEKVLFRLGKHVVVWRQSVEASP